MKSIALSILLVLTFGSIACREEGPAERAGAAIDQAAEDAGEAVEDAGEAIGDAAEDAKEKARKSLE